MVDPSHSEFTGAHLHSITSLSLKRWPADTLWLTWWQSWLPLTSCSEILTDESCRKISERSTTNLVEVSTGREALSGHAAALSCPAGRGFVSTAAMKEIGKILDISETDVALVVRF